jgi:leucyl aminopeptidase
MQTRFTTARQAKPVDLVCYFFDGSTPQHAADQAPGLTAPPESLPLRISPAPAGKGLVLSVQLKAFENLHPCDVAKVAGAACIKHARQYQYKSLRFHLEDTSLETFERLLEGVLLVEYQFKHYKGGTAKAKPESSLELEISAGSQNTQYKNALARIEKTIAAVNYARDLANTPGSDLVPEDLAAAAKALAKQYGFTYTQLTAAQLKQQGYVGITAVGQASEHAPVLFSLEYKPAKVKAGVQPLCFVGKGITFDTGGISIKPWDLMWEMKGDMGGAAAVLGIFKAIGELKPGLPVTGVVGAAENMPGGKAYLPGDVLRYKNGRTVEIRSTDAEGRLVLADALLHAQRKLKQNRIVEFSTLTGACFRALGPQYIGLMSNFAGLAALVAKAGEVSGELTCTLPLHPEYHSQIKSTVADIKNSGGALAGAQTAGWFLHEFLDEGTQYVHLDIAGPFATDKDNKYWSEPGATGVGVRLGTALLDALVS